MNRRQWIARVRGGLALSARPLVAAAAVETSTDFRLTYPRTEYHSARCGGHQGLLFKDGPPPTGKRYCNNGVAPAFVPEGTNSPALRT
jgi:peptide-methionine (R)-S-oxide reductase